MITCIICRETDVTGSDEHVIPDALGGLLHITNICTKCNSFLGTKVDAKLTEHGLIKLLRYIYRIKNKSNKLINPIKGNFTSPKNPEMKVQYRLDNNNRLKPYIIQQPCVKVLDDKIEISVTLDEDDFSKRDQIINKICRKNGIKTDNYSIEHSTTNIDLSDTKITIDFDMRDFKIGILKIAYEFAICKIPAYFFDKTAIKIANILKTANIDDAIKFTHGELLNNSIQKEFHPYIKHYNHNHYLILCGLKNIGLICYVCLFDTIDMAVKLSDDYNLCPTQIFGINDHNARKFITKNLYEFANDQVNYLTSDCGS